MVPAPSAQAVAPTPDELGLARRFVAAKFEDPEKPAPRGPGLIVHVNNNAVERNSRGNRPLRIADKEYARGDVTTNTVEGYFSIFKRGMVGVYQHCGEQHLQRYLTEFDFRYSNRKMTDAERTEVALQGAEGRRLKYVQPHKRKAS